MKLQFLTRHVVPNPFQKTTRIASLVRKEFFIPSQKFFSNFCKDTNCLSCHSNIKINRVRRQEWACTGEQKTGCCFLFFNVCSFLRVKNVEEEAGSEALVGIFKTKQQTRNVLSPKSTISSFPLDLELKSSGIDILNMDHATPHPLNLKTHHNIKKWHCWSFRLHWNANRKNIRI